jgi:hypothetical protein
MCTAWQQGSFTTPDMQQLLVTRVQYVTRTHLHMYLQQLRHAVAAAAAVPGLRVLVKCAAKNATHRKPSQLVV